MRILKIAGFLLLAALLAGGFVAYRMYTKPHRSIEQEKALTITASQLAADYESNETGANKKYLDKAILVKGAIADLASNQEHKTVVTLQGTDMIGVQCTLQGTETGLKNGDVIEVKGFCTGYLTDVVLDRCILVK
jgi:hypothetical protein